MTKLKFSVEIELEDLISLQEDRSRDGSNPPPPPPNGQGGDEGDTGDIRPEEGENGPPDSTN